MPKSTGLRTEILITLTLLMGAALLLGGVLMLRLTEQSLLEQKVVQLRLLTETIGGSLGASYRQSNLELGFSPEALEQLPEELLVSGWWLYNSELKLLASFHTESAVSLSVAQRQRVKRSKLHLELVTFPTLLQMFTNADAKAKFVQPILRNNKFLGLLEIHYSLEDIRYRLLLSQRWILLYVLLYGSTLVLVGYYLLQRNVIKPARNLLQATEDVSHGNLETRLPVAGPAEIAQLAEAYNQMVAALQESRQETHQQITILEQTNLELQQARDEVIRSEKLASVGQLAAGLAHELGNPLAALIGYLEVLKLQLANSAQQDIVDRSLVETSRVDFLVRELLDFSRPDGHDQIDNVDMVTELNSCLQLLKNQGVLANVAIANHLPGVLPPIKINRNRLQQVMVNLFLNAAQACSDGGEIALRAGEVEQAVWFSIADNGPGIAESDLERIFEPFYTTKDPGKGTGLGLAICLQIVEMAGGSIKVESELNRGTQFRLFFSENLTGQNLHETGVQ